ncbi:MAG: hypothetical protein WC969_04880 [Elusimicrobiota bacterium]
MRSLADALGAASCGFVAEALPAPLPAGPWVRVRAGAAAEAAYAALGAGFAGLRAAAAVDAAALPAALDALALAAEAEVPLVLLVLGSAPDALRLEPGPGCPALVLPAGSTDARTAFVLADAWQAPVVLLGAERAAPVPFTPDPGRGFWMPELAPGTDYDRYADLPDGVSPRAAPGMAGRAFAAPDPSVDPARATMLAAKRRRKAANALRALAQRSYPSRRNAPPLPPETDPVVDAELLPPDAYLRAGAPEEPASRALAGALARAGTRPKDVLLVCGGEAPADFAPALGVYRLHAPGGALAAAAGAKRANPGLRVLASGAAQGADLRAYVECARDAVDLLYISRGPAVPLSSVSVESFAPRAPGAEESLAGALARKGFRVLEHM